MFVRKPIGIFPVAELIDATQHRDRPHVVGPDIRAPGTKSKKLCKVGDYRNFLLTFAF